MRIREEKKKTDARSRLLFAGQTAWLSNIQTLISIRHLGMLVALHTGNEKVFETLYSKSRKKFSMLLMQYLFLYVTLNFPVFNSSGFRRNFPQKKEVTKGHILMFRT